MSNNDIRMKKGFGKKKRVFTITLTKEEQPKGQINFHI